MVIDAPRLIVVLSQAYVPASPALQFTRGRSRCVGCRVARTVAACDHRAPCPPTGGAGQRARPGPDCLAAAGAFGKAMQEVFTPPPLPCPDDCEIARWAWQLAGITTLADWVGSRQAWFPYVTPEAVAEPNHAQHANARGFRKRPD